MKFFLDTADIDEIKEAHDLGILDGVTTNPTLAARAGKTIPQAVTDICKVVSGPVSAEVTSTDTEGMLVEARKLVEIASNIVVKIPLIKAGLKAVKRLTEEGINTNVTLCFQPVQALLAAKAGASYISPFIGRLDDISQRGMDIVEDIRLIYDNYGYETEIIVASIRQPTQILEAARAGADICTVPFAVFDKLVNHPLTTIGLEKFLADYNKVAGEA